MPQYRDLYQSANKKKKRVSKKMQELIDRERRALFAEEGSWECMGECDSEEICICADLQEGM
tara:strand:+ start:2111 stop:2296 length:186 start_codon:yes stop_codon:yes gene_type:complete